MVIAVLIFLHKLLEIFLNDALNVGVHRRNQVVTVFCINHRSLQIRGIVQISILTSRCPVQCVVVIFLQSECTFVICSGKTKCMGHQRSVRIGPGIGSLKPDSLDILILLIHLLSILQLGIQILQLGLICGAGFLCLNFLFDVGYPLFSIRDFFFVRRLLFVRQSLAGNVITRIRIVMDVLLNGASVQSKSLTCVKRWIQVGTDPFVILRAVVHLVGIHNDIINQLAGRKHRSVSIRDAASLIRNFPGIIGSLGKHLLLVLVSVVPVNHEKAQNQHSKSQQHRNKQHYQLRLHFVIESSRTSFVSAAIPTVSVVPAARASVSCHAAIFLSLILQLRHLPYIVARSAVIGYDLVLFCIGHPKLCNRTVLDIVEVNGGIDLIQCFIVVAFQAGKLCLQLRNLCYRSGHLGLKSDIFYQKKGHQTHNSDHKHDQRRIHEIFMLCAASVLCSGSALLRRCAARRLWLLFPGLQHRSLRSVPIFITVCRITGLPGSMLISIEPVSACMSSPRGSCCISAIIISV